MIPRVLAASVLVCCGACAAACAGQSSRPSAEDLHRLQDRVSSLEQATKSVADKRPASTEDAASDPVLLSLQQKTVKLIPLGEGKPPAKQVVSQWLFRLKGEDDGSLVCVDDASRCITLKALREQLFRPANDPAGIR
jgi:hypothetical protein